MVNGAPIKSVGFSGSAEAAGADAFVEPDGCAPVAGELDGDELGRDELADGAALDEPVGSGPPVGELPVADPPEVLPQPARISSPTSVDAQRTLSRIWLRRGTP
jgi:hypothetical protein